MIEKIIKFLFCFFVSFFFLLTGLIPFAGKWYSFIFLGLFAVPWLIYLNVIKFSSVVMIVILACAGLVFATMAYQGQIPPVAYLIYGGLIAYYIYGKVKKRRRVKRIQEMLREEDENR